ncbi:helix-turn-helix domain-containing protein [Lachnospiraceae bacterium LCP25S3_G4]
MTQDNFAKKITAVMMHPVRLRIIQAIALKEEATTAQIATELSDIPPATLYRHMRTLEGYHLIKVVKEIPKRGTVEKVFVINPDAFPKENEIEQGEQLINATFLSLTNSFHQYFASGNVDMVSDHLFLGTSTLLLSDEEMEDFTAKIGSILNEYLQNKTTETRKPRRITFISSPCEND